MRIDERRPRTFTVRGFIILITSLFDFGEFYRHTCLADGGRSKMAFLDPLEGTEVGEITSVCLLAFSHHSESDCGI